MLAGVPFFDEVFRQLDCRWVWSFSFLELKLHSTPALISILISRYIRIPHLHTPLFCNLSNPSSSIKHSISKTLFNSQSWLDEVPLSLFHRVFADSVSESNGTPPKGLSLHP
jgi:hypothetical protein